MRPRVPREFTVLNFFQNFEKSRGTRVPRKYFILLYGTQMTENLIIEKKNFKSITTTNKEGPTYLNKKNFFKHKKTFLNEKKPFKTRKNLF